MFIGEQGTRSMNSIMHVGYSHTRICHNPRARGKGQGPKLDAPRAKMWPFTAANSIFLIFIPHHTRTYFIVPVEKYVFFQPYNVRVQLWMKPRYEISSCTPNVLFFALA